MFNLFKKEKFTSATNPIEEIQNEKGISKYVSKLSKFSPDELFTEFASVRAAKHNMLLSPVSPKKLHETQGIVTDLNDKTFIIIISALGKDNILNFINSNCFGDIGNFHKIVDALDNETAQLNLNLPQHGKHLLDSLKKQLHDEHKTVTTSARELTEKDLVFYGTKGMKVSTVKFYEWLLYENKHWFNNPKYLAVEYCYPGKGEWEKFTIEGFYLGSYELDLQDPRLGDAYMHHWVCKDEDGDIYMYESYNSPFLAIQSSSEDTEFIKLKKRFNSELRIEIIENEDDESEIFVSEEIYNKIDALCS